MERPRPLRASIPFCRSIAAVVALILTTTLFRAARKRRFSRVTGARFSSVNLAVMWRDAGRRLIALRNPRQAPVRQFLLKLSTFEYRALHLQAPACGEAAPYSTT